MGASDNKKQAKFEPQQPAGGLIPTRLQMRRRVAIFKGAPHNTHTLLSKSGPRAETPHRPPDTLLRAPAEYRFK
jgi:hypothetical protein